MRALVVIPSRDRPEELLQAVHSVLMTAKSVDVAAYIDDDQLEPYTPVLSVLSDQRFVGHVGQRKTPVEAVNWVVGRHGEYQAFGLITDDARMTTPGWDEFLFAALSQFPRQVGVVSPYHNQGNHVDMPFVSKSWVEATGWFACPTCQHYCWPIITGLIGEMSAIMHAPMDKFAIHHPHKVEMVSLEKRNRDAQAFFEFVSLDLPKTVERVREAMQPPLPQEVRATIEAEYWP